MIREQLRNTIKDAVEIMSQNGKLGELQDTNTLAIIIEKPKNPQFGDFSINVAPWAKLTKMSPQIIANELIKTLSNDEFNVSLAGCFVNFKLKNNIIENVVATILKSKENFGSNSYGQNEKVMLEYISANPTGPLHIGHGRWAAMGSALANIMNFSGYDIYQEFYINDAGNQIHNLAKSLYIRILQELGQKIDFPTDEVEVKNYYTGEYLIPTAKSFIEEHHKEALAIKEFDKETEKMLADYAKATMLEQQKKLLDTLNVKFDNFYSETILHKSGKVVECLEKLEKTGYTYKEDGALWFKSSILGDEKDRVLIKQDGAYTYLSADIAYHLNKLERGFTSLINIWGADHHGYVPRMKAALEAFSYKKEQLEVLLGQLVNLIINNEQVRMGKRKKMITLEELVEEVGTDATRFWMINRDINTTLDFDVDLAKSKADENPVFYVQYAHARVCSIIRNLSKPRLNVMDKTELPPLFTEEEIENIKNKKINELNLADLWSDNESENLATKNLILMLDSFEDVILSAAKNRAPYLVSKYTMDLAADFHKFYNAARVITDNKQLSVARIELILAVKTVLKNAFDILGISAPESM